MPYQAPVQEYKFLFDHVLRFDRLRVHLVSSPHLITAIPRVPFRTGGKYYK